VTVINDTLLVKFDLRLSNRITLTFLNYKQHNLRKKMVELETRVRQTPDILHKGLLKIYPELMIKEHKTNAKKIIQDDIRYSVKFMWDRIELAGVAHHFKVEKNVGTREESICESYPELLIFPK